MKRNKVVVWSGGYDSSLVLINTLENLSNDKLMVISIIHIDIGKIKNIKEVNARSNLKKWIKKNYRAIYKSIEFREIVCNNFTTKGLYNQPTIWVTSILPHIPDNSDIYFGYIRGDDFWHLANRFGDAITGIMQLKFGIDADFSVNYPLEWSHKHEVITELERRNIPKDCFWYCEGQTKKQCGECTPCITHKYAKLRIKDGKKRRKKLIKAMTPVASVSD